jgi:NAD(P)-dependent dehydrogenase (short-subunit alcohol dehydrogenase family)
VIFAPDLLQGRVAVVTGGGTGIGRGIALEMARAGARVVVCGRRQEPLQSTVSEIKALGREGLALPVDVRDWDSVQGMVATVVEQMGTVDVLVNNAGGQFGSPFAQMSPKGWRAVVELNLNGVFHCTRAVADTMIAKQRGKVVNIITGFTRRAAPNLAHSGAARAGVENLTRSLALEWAPHNIQVNCISPVVMTEAMEANMAAQGGPERFVASIPAGRASSAQEVGWLAVYLASPAADFMTGEHIVLDGGYWLATGMGRGAQ